MNQRAYQRSGSGRSQCARILAHLEANKNQWVSMPILARIGSGSPNGFCVVHSRISDLRKQGHDIQHSNKHEGQQIHSAYKLLSVVATEESTTKEPVTV